MKIKAGTKVLTKANEEVTIICFYEKLNAYRVSKNKKEFLIDPEDVSKEVEIKNVKQ